ncbi:cation:proton antiporter [Streptomyces hirsutus]|uniref:cation:proton antiporter n=1 Tax=Streptomyces hirsutus TaxID=35620 RepID=UPI0033CBFAA4
MILLLLILGLDFTAREFTAGLRRHRPSAVVDLVLNAIPGAVAGWLFGLDAAGVLALAGATYVSSSGIIARLLGDLRRLGNRETPAVLSVLVLEDFAMAACPPPLAVVTAGGGWWEALLAVLAATLVVGAAVGASSRWGHHVGRVLSPADAEQVLLRVLGFTLVVAALAELVHVSAAVGAFLVGLTLTGAAAERARTVLSPLRDLFAAVFFSLSACRPIQVICCPRCPPLRPWPSSPRSPRRPQGGMPQAVKERGDEANRGPGLRSSSAASSRSSSSDLPLPHRTALGPWSPAT